MNDSKATDSKRRASVTAGNLSALLVDQKDVLTPDEYRKLVAARVVLVSLIRKLS